MTSTLAVRILVGRGTRTRFTIASLRSLHDDLQEKTTYDVVVEREPLWSWPEPAPRHRIYFKGVGVPTEYL